MFTRVRLQRLTWAMVRDLQELTGRVSTGGHGMLLDLLLLKDKGLIATSFVDGRIHLWSEDYMRPKGVLEGHKLGRAPPVRTT